MDSISLNTISYVLSTLKTSVSIDGIRYYSSNEIQEIFNYNKIKICFGPRDKTELINV